MTRKMMLMSALAALVALAAVTLARNVDAQTPGPMNPVGTWNVSTLTEEGMQMTGVLTVRASGGDYTGQMESPEVGTVPITQLTTSANHFVAVFTADESLAVAWMEKQEDGTLTGSWHQLGPGLGVKMTKTK